VRGLDEAVKGERVLLVDDEPDLLEAMGDLLRRRFQIETALGPIAGLTALERTGPHAVVVADMHMPGMHGLDFLSQVQRIAPDTIRIMLTGSRAFDTAVAAVNTVGVFRFLTKPCDHDSLVGALNAGIEHYRLAVARQQLTAVLNRELAASRHQSEAAQDLAIEGWVRALDLRDRETAGHSERVTRLAVCLARQLGIGDEALVHVRRGALLHDIGKLGVPDRILHKPGPLDADEWALMRQHPLYACRLLGEMPSLQEALEIPRSHHEWWDGSGYPDGMKGEEIPLAARVFAVVDVWDAITSDRPYRRPLSKEAARDHLRAEAGTHFDPQVVEAFLALDVDALIELDTTPGDTTLGDTTLG
jgi:putative two-component system response regulator